MSLIQPTFYHVYQNLKHLSQETSVMELARCLQTQLLELFDMDLCVIFLSYSEDPFNQIFFLSQTNLSNRCRVEIKEGIEEYFELFCFEGGGKKETQIHSFLFEENKKTNETLDDLNPIYQQPIFFGNKKSGVIALYDREKIELDQEEVCLVGIWTYTFGILVKSFLLYEKVRILSIIDSLTGIYNKRHILQRLCEEFSEAIRYQQSFSVMIL